MIRRLLRRIRYGRPVIVVSGLPRSGTSMAMRMLQAGGMPTTEDGQRTADVDNPKGYFEDERVKNLARDDDKSWLRECRGRAVKIISYLLKELPADNNYRVIVMQRELAEVLASQSKMLTHRAEEDGAADERMAENFEAVAWRASYLLRRAPHFESLEVDYRAVIEDPRREAERINAFLGGGLDVDRMVEAVDPSLYRNRAEPEAGS